VPVVLVVIYGHSSGGWAGAVLVWLFVILKASKGEWDKLPIITDFA
jgi:uncharacterized membrane protein